MGLVGKCKALFLRFRQWQREPFHYKPLKDDLHVCLNCQQEYAGKFCPRCGQSVKTERNVGWNTMKDGMMDVFDLETTSLLRTFWHLLCRPGYLVNDYLSGKRKICTPPVNTLVMVGMVYFLMKSCVGKQPVETELSLPEEGHIFYDTVKEWTSNNAGWYYVISALFLMLSTWVFFHHAPRHPRHTLVEGFYIQVFMLMLMLIIEILIMIFCGNRPSVLSYVLWPLYYTFTLGSIFGYNWWGTLWRSAAVLYAGARLMVTVYFLVDIVQGHPFSDYFWRHQSLLTAIMVSVLLGGYLIGWYTERLRLKRNAP